MYRLEEQKKSMTIAPIVVAAGDVGRFDERGRKSFWTDHLAITRIFSFCESLSHASRNTNSKNIYLSIC